MKVSFRLFQIVTTSNIIDNLKAAKVNSRVEVICRNPKTGPSPYVYFIDFRILFPGSEKIRNILAVYNSPIITWRMPNLGILDVFLVEENHLNCLKVTKHQNELFKFNPFEEKVANRII